MGSAGGPSSQTTTTTSQPPAYALPYISQALGYTGQIFNPYAQYGGPEEQVAPFSPTQGYAFQAAGGPEFSAATGIGQGAAAQEADILGGKYLGPSTNPYLKQYYEAAAAPMVNQYEMATSPDITAQAVQQGALGSTGQDQSQQYAKWGLGQNLSNLAAGIYEPAYEQGLQQLTTALGMSPQLQAGQFTPSQELLGIGNQQQAQQQAQLEAEYRNQLAAFQFPLEQAQQYANQVEGLAGLGNRQVQIGPNPMQTAK